MSILIKLTVDLLLGKKKIKIKGGWGSRETPNTYFLIAGTLPLGFSARHRETKARMKRLAEYYLLDCICGKG